MNSLELPPPFQLSTDTSHWDEVRRIYRRVCVLRALGRDEEASTVENRDLSRALTTARAAAESDHEEAAVLAAEAERVLNASVIAELLAPMLAEKLSGLAPVAMPSPAPAIAPAALNTLARPPQRPRAIEAAPEATPAMAESPKKPATVPSIADLIDGMLAQES